MVPKTLLSTGKIVVSNDDFWKLIFEGGPISRRAWCLQERHLSPRVLHILDNGVMLFECESIHSTNLQGCHLPFIDAADEPQQECEEVPKTYWKRAVDLKAATYTSNYLSYWHEMLDDFQKRHLTCGSDNLVAMNGLAVIFQEMTGFTYLAGLWKEDLPRGLLWC